MLLKERFYLFIISVLLVFLMPTALLAQNALATVLCFPLGAPDSEPVIELEGSRQLFFSFDDLSGEERGYNYKILHCDPEWNPSGLNSFMYLEGFAMNPLEEYDYSYNTDNDYVHYSLLLPNENVKFKISGNYLLQIVDSERPDSVLISQRFAVLENSVEINTSVVTSSLPEHLNASQQIDIAVRYGNLPVYNPMRDVRMYISRNQDPNTCRKLEPTFVRRGELVYGNGSDNLFDGLSPFRNFSSSDLVYYSQYVREIVKGPDGYQHVILQPASVPQRYVYTPDKNGGFIVDVENFVEDAGVEADYVFVHFALLYPEEIPDADVYVYGKFSGWHLLPELKMKYDYEHGAYVGEAFLKQGHYDYMFALLPKDRQKPEFVSLQNSFYQTRNEYNIRFYFYDMKLRCYRLVGYKKINAVL